jgi:hypothetical protein
MNLIETLSRVEGNSLFLESLKRGIDMGQHDLVIQMIQDQMKDNKPLVSQIIGEDLANHIESSLNHGLVA